MFKQFSFFIIISLLSYVTHAEDLTDIEISAPSEANSAINNEAISDVKTRNIVDGGDLLQSINGVNVIRRGGHGLDPVIRGQSDQRLNTFIDGAMIYGSCSVKMDTASTYINAESYDTVTVMKGTQSVMFGSGGSGGVVSFKRVTEPYSSINSSPFKMKFGQTFDGNSETFSSIADITYSNGSSYLRLNGNYTEAGNYETGTGLKLQSEYKTANSSLILGSRLDDGSKVEFTYTDNRQDDVGYPGLPMDINYSYADIYNFKYHRVVPLGVFSSMRIEAFNSDMSHLMDNYVMRSTNTMKTFASSDTYGWRVHGALDNNARMGIDYEHNTRDAEQNMIIMGTNRHLTYMWPGVEISKLGLFYEKDNMMSDTKIFSYGIRWDQIEADAKRASDVPSGGNGNQVSANSLYTAHYTGTVTATKRDWNSFSGFLRLQESKGPMSKYYISASLNERTPDATELFHAKNSMAMGAKYRDRHVGNPNLDSEKHLTMEFGVEEMIIGNHINASIYFTDIDDYITTYRVSDGTYDNTVNDARVYKNVDATIWGYEISLARKLTQNVKTKINVNYTNGNDDTQNRPLPQIMPLSGNIVLDYESISSNYGVRLNFSDSQDRFDSRVLDTGKTGGFTTIDLFVGFELAPGMDLNFGISNITDKRYSSHLSNANVLDASATKVDEPGRSIWGSVIYDF